MNIVQLQDQLKNFSQDQLVREMQTPSGNAPQFLVLGEIMRRQKMQQDFTAQQAKGDQGTVAQEAVAAAGVPQGGIADMARAMAPSTDMTQNTGVQAMYAGGPVKKMAEGDKVVRGGRVYIEQEDGTYLREDGGARILTPGQALSRDVGALTDIDVGGGLRSVFQPVGDTLRGIFQPVGEAARETLQPVGDSMRETLQPVGTAMTEALQPVGQDLQTLFDPRVVEPSVPTSEFTTADINAAIEAAAAKDQTARTMEDIQAERAPFLRLPPAPDRSGGTSGTERNLGENSLARIPELLATEINVGPDGTITTAAPEKPMPSRADRDQQGGGIAAETAAVEKAAEDKAAADAAAAAAQTPSGGAGGAGGVGGVSSYEQALMDALSSREKAAQQDKWLALAQVGLNLMSSTQPTLGGALGEAGLKGVEAARGARDQYDKEKLEILGALEQSRAARAKAARSGASGGLSGIKLSQYLPQLRYAADAAADRVSLLTGGMDPNMAISMAEEEGDNARAVEIRRAYNEALQANSDYTNVVRNIGGLEGFAPEEDDTSFSARE
jgi:hypothetical protein